MWKQKGDKDLVDVSRMNTAVKIINQKINWNV